MNNTTDFIASVYDILAKTFSFGDTNAKICLQMAWPGIAVNQADFKDANGQYNANVAEETFSALANIAPAFSKSKFENSGFEIEDLYEIILASALPTGVPDAEKPTNPMYKLFSDAQFEFVNSVKGGTSGPNAFYHPCRATPSNWYDQAAAAFWPQVNIASGEVKPATQENSFFIKNNGLNLINKGVWKIKPKIGTDADLKNQLLEKSQYNRTQMVKQYAAVQQPFSANVLTVNAQQVVTAFPKPSAGTFSTGVFSTVVIPTAVIPTGAISTVMLSQDFKTQFSTFNASSLNKKLVPVNSFDKNSTVLSALQPQQINRTKYQVVPKSVSIKQALFLNDLLVKDLPTQPASAATNGFSISFGFCRVNIDRTWLKLALLSGAKWCIYGYPAGEYSNGSIENNPGMFSMLPTSFIVINNLKITANWSADDKNAIANGVSFGPFDIRNGSFNQNTLQVNGMQIIASITKIMPQLAPNDSI